MAITKLSNQVYPGKRKIIEADIKLKDSIKSGLYKTLEIFVVDSLKHLKDHFLLLKDIKDIEENRYRGFFDYGFLLLPVHKALEGYCEMILATIFEQKLSKKPNETIGYYLNIEDSRKKLILDEFVKNRGFKLNTEEWIKAWNGLKDEWNKNRNPQTHFGLECIETIEEAEQIAGSIIREINISGKLIYYEYYLPLLEIVKKDIEEKEQQAKKAEKKEKIIEGYMNELNKKK